MDFDAGSFSGNVMQSDDDCRDSDEDDRGCRASISDAERDSGDSQEGSNDDGKPPKKKNVKTEHPALGRLPATQSIEQLTKRDEFTTPTRDPPSHCKRKIIACESLRVGSIDLIFPVCTYIWECQQFTASASSSFRGHNPS